MKLIRILPVLIFFGLAGFFWRGLDLDPHQLPTPKIGKALPRFDLPLLVGLKTQHFHSDLFRNHYTVLVVWASWCETCRDEQEFLLTLARQAQISLYGLNYKDDPAQARRWLADWGNPFQVIGLDKDGTFALELGVYGTPETYLIDKQGLIMHRYAGALTAEVWRKEFLPLLSLA